MNKKNWNWKYARWLVYVRKALISTGYCMNGVYPDPKAWRHYFDSKLMPFEAVNMDMGYNCVSVFYREEDTF